MAKRPDSCLQRTSTAKTAGGPTIFLLEELGDARMRHAQLKKYVQEAIEIVEKSDKRDHIFEVAGHLLHGIPDTLFKMEKALDAAAMAGARLDYEEIKQTLKPEKADELEDVLKDIRLHYPQQRRSQEPPMTPKQAAEQLLAMAEETQSTGQVPLAKVMTLLAAVEGDEVVKTASAETVASSFVLWANAMRQDPKRGELAARLRNLIGQEIQATPAQVAASIYQTASSREQVMEGFAKANPSMTDEQLEKAADMWEKHKDSLKKAHEAEPVLAAAPADIPDNVYDRHVDGIEKALKDIKAHLAKPAASRPYDDVATLFNEIRQTASVITRRMGKQASDVLVGEEEEHVAKFEEGKPADPTENMSPEDKATWWKKHEENKDNFKSASATWKKTASTNPWKVNAAINIRNQPLGNGVTREVLVKALFDGANTIFDCRGDVRAVWEALRDGADGLAARIGPLAGGDYKLAEAARQLATQINKWDHECGDVARELENFARGLKKLG